ncbi:protoporphyrinogen/coproporphyrinogen oxidase [Butyrivibrio proteoclasticus]|uniref:protoporphyrinogen/coproporphyrinogen oxidase n=1 Tax=Butyrivibrio proteoclasticus TaxID=43305 RepID=UPI0004794C32|nr:FAD-dependent oxidoreductase [Butyrivibrio proteoclasticus]
MKVKYLILGAGPTGLSVANYLLNNGEKDLLLLEAEGEVGGLCRSKDIDGAPLDIGGGHFLDVRRPEVCEFLFGFMPRDEWDSYERDSRIRFKTFELHHPFEANIWELPEDEQQKFLDSISEAGCNTGAKKPEKFIDWITWKLGDKIAEEYMLPYNRKMFGDNLNDLGIYWLDKLPDVSYEETLESCRQKKAFGKQPGHAQFFYPKKYGYGEIWLRMGDALGNALKTSEKVKELNLTDRSVRLGDGTQIEAEFIITTIPWSSIELKNAPQEVADAAKSLRHTSIEVTYHEEDMDTDAQWIYFPDEDKDYHRILVRKNFFPGAKGYWTETRSERYRQAQGSINFTSEYAYPINTLDKPNQIGCILRFAKENGVYGVGRWGEHTHYNSDASVQLAMNLAKELLS